MKTTQYEVVQKRLSETNQTAAYKFVGRFFSEFTMLEMFMDNVIISYLTVDPALSQLRRQEIYDKNTSISTIFTHSVLGSPYFNFQMKSDMIRAIMQDRKPIFFSKFGTNIFSLITRLQKTRNHLAHYQTYVHGKRIYISKPKTDWVTPKVQTQKGGIQPISIGRYEAMFFEECITKETQKRIMFQLQGISIIISFFSSNIGSVGRIKTSDETLDNAANSSWMFEGGVFDLEIIK